MKNKTINNLNEQKTTPLNGVNYNENKQNYYK